MPDQIAPDVVAVLSFTLTDADGEVLETTGEGRSFAYLHGHGNLPDTLEGVLVGLSAGDAFDAEIADAFGADTDAPAQPVHKRELPKEVRKSLQPGLRFQARGSDGTAHWLWISEVKGSRAWVTAQHPLAGKTVRFAGEVHRLREPTASELEHGHAHGADGHHHAH